MCLGGGVYSGGGVVVVRWTSSYGDGCFKGGNFDSCMIDIP